MTLADLGSGFFADIVYRRPHRDVFKIDVVNVQTFFASGKWIYNSKFIIKTKAILHIFRY